MHLGAAAGAVRAVARSFNQGDATLAQMWSALHSNLDELCRDHPLEGDFLDLFLALERWEVAEDSDRETAADAARAAAGRLAREA